MLVHALYLYTPALYDLWYPKLTIMEPDSNLTYQKARCQFRGTPSLSVGK